MEAYKYAGGGWGAVFVTAGLVIGGVVGLGQPSAPKYACAEYEAGSYFNCARTIKQVDPNAVLGNGAGGVVLGSFAGLIVWLGIKEYHKGTGAKPDL